MFGWLFLIIVLVLCIRLRKCVCLFGVFRLSMSECLLWLNCVNVLVLNCCNVLLFGGLILIMLVLSWCSSVYVCGLGSNWLVLMICMLCRYDYVGV